MPRVRRSILAGAEPLSARRKWRAILLATLVLTPGYWSMLAGLVAVGSDDDGAPLAAPYIAFGLALLPFVFVVLAFLSEHPRAPGAVVKAMLLALVVGIPISAIAADAVTGLVAGLGAGGIAALRADIAHSTTASGMGLAVIRRQAPAPSRPTERPASRSRSASASVSGWPIGLVGLASAGS